MDDKRRNDRNKDIVDRMRAGDKLSSFSSHDSWFPPRPIIRKDKSLMAKLYNEETKDSERKTLTVLPAKIDHGV